MTAFGIDLGTTHSCVSMIDEAGRPVIVKNAVGEETTPSVVYFESASNVLVGSVAKNSALLEPDRVAQLVKRDMGKPVSYWYNGQQHSPEAVSALILRELVRATRQQVGEVMSDVVITVPAYFGVAEREATRRAGQIAGLNVLDVLAEPVAAAIAYRVERGVTELKHVLVYDLGGGTFDVSVIRLDGDDIAVVCTDGIDNLGGADWDKAIADYLLSQFAAEHPGSDPASDPRFMQDLLIAAEQLKKHLSAVQKRRHILRFAGAVTRVELDRAQVEEMTAPLLERTVAVTERAIAAARRAGVTEFDNVILVGGMSKLPAVTRILKDRLGLEAQLYDPDLAVAKGAALFALMRTIGDNGKVSPKAAEDAASQTGMTVPEVVALASKRVTTVLPRAFGVKGVDGRDPIAAIDPVNARQMVVHLLRANTPLPADTGPYTFHTAVDNQRMVGIEVWEQASEFESDDPAENRKVGEALLRDLPARLPARSPFEVTFLMSELGVLSVHAIEPKSGADVRFDLNIGGLGAADVAKAKAAVARYDVSG
ncbi:MAG TPA: Hsp70 family protein [Streptosporangiaceae bacterium]|nr:Hsp70 family protein [Streptosporangiaceae bacterium]